MKTAFAVKSGETAALSRSTKRGGRAFFTTLNACRRDENEMGKESFVKPPHPPPPPPFPPSNLSRRDT